MKNSGNTLDDFISQFIDCCETVKVAYPSISPHDIIPKCCRLLIPFKMLDISASLRIEPHNVDDIVSFRDKCFYPASGWNYLMRRNMQEITSGLFLGPYSSAMKERQNDLLQQGITHIICVRDSSEAHFIHPQLDENFTYMTVDVADSEFESMLRFFPAVINFINKALDKKGKVLVHGNAGISRSATLVLAYVMNTFNYSYMQALRFVKEKRGCVNPNAGFAHQLHEYEVIYKTHNNFFYEGQSSKMDSNRKRKSDETGDDYELDDVRGSAKKVPNVVSHIFERTRS